MPKDNDIERKTLDRLIQDLDTKSRQQHVDEHSDQYWVCQRRYPRYAFRADCTVRCMGTLPHEIICLPGRTRNLSRGGLGVLVNRAFTLGEPLEVELQLPNQPIMFVAGLIQFVRYAGRGYHELGVALKCAGPKPVFSRDPATAMATLAWLRRPEPVGQ
jgi:hypothetical protein